MTAEIQLECHVGGNVPFATVGFFRHAACGGEGERSLGTPSNPCQGLRPGPHFQKTYLRNLEDSCAPK